MLKWKIIVQWHNLPELLVLRYWRETVPSEVIGLVLSGMEDWPHDADRPGNWRLELTPTGESSRIVSLLSAQPPSRVTSTGVILILDPCRDFTSKLHLMCEDSELSG